MSRYACGSETFGAASGQQARDTAREGDAPSPEDQPGRELFYMLWDCLKKKLPKQKLIHRTVIAKLFLEI
jgi:hypothetical protein